nr:hypothetical protein CFP56_59678 [Quercus suber]
MFYHSDHNGRSQPQSRARRTPNPHPPRATTLQIRRHRSRRRDVVLPLLPRAIRRTGIAWLETPVGSLKSVQHWGQTNGTGRILKVKRGSTRLDAVAADSTSSHCGNVHITQPRSTFGVFIFSFSWQEILRGMNNACREISRSDRNAIQLVHSVSESSRFEEGSRMVPSLRRIH